MAQTLRWNNLVSTKKIYLHDRIPERHFELYGEPKQRHRNGPALLLSFPQSAADADHDQKLRAHMIGLCALHLDSTMLQTNSQKDNFNAPCLGWPYFLETTQRSTSRPTDGQKRFVPLVNNHRWRKPIGQAKRCIQRAGYVSLTPTRLSMDDPGMISLDGQLSMDDSGMDDFWWMILGKVTVDWRFGWLSTDDPG